MKPIGMSKALLILIASVAIVPIVDTIAKALSSELTPSFLVCSRYLVSFLVALFVFKAPVRAYSSFHKSKLLHISRSAILMLSMTFFFWSISKIPIAIALGGYFTGPIIATLLSSIFLKEPLYPRNIVSIGVCFFGIFLIIGPSDLSVHSVLLSVISGFLYGVYIVLIRASSISVRAEDSLLIQNFLGFLLSFPLAIKGFMAVQFLSFYGMLLILLMGVLSFFSHYLSLKSLKVIDIKTAAPFFYFEIIFSALIGWLVFGDFPSMTSWGGITLIILSGVLTLRPMKSKQTEIVNN